MKICYVCADPGIPIGGRKGASAHVRGIIRAFARCGHDIVVLSGADGEDPGLGVPVLHVAPPRVTRGLSLDARSRMARALCHLWMNVAVEQALERVLVELRPDLVYERYSPFSVAGGIVAGALGIAHFLEVNAPLAREGAQYRQQALGEAADALEQSAFAATDRILTVSEELRDELLAAGVSPSRVTVLPNGVDTEMFTDRGPDYRERFGGAIVIGFVGSLKPWHALDTLAEAFRSLAPDPRFHLLIVGEGPMARELERLEAELPGRVHLVGGVSHADVAAYVRTMDIAVAPYPALERFYFSPLKVLEYMAAARAVVATRIGQVERLVEDGETGLLVPPDDPGRLAATIRSLADDVGARRRLGAQAAEVTRREHTWQERAERIVALAERGEPHRGAAEGRALR